MVRDAVRTGYDLRAAEFGSSPTKRHRSHRVGVPDIPNGAVVLDVGCGTGRSTAPVLATNRARMVVGVDLSAAMLRRAIEEHTSAHEVAWTQGDAEWLPYPSSAFDVVISRRALSHLPDPCDAFKEIARVTRPGGIVDVTLFGDRAMGRPVERMLRSALREVAGSRADDLIGLFTPPTIATVDAAAYGADLRTSSLAATTTYAWDDPDRLVGGLLNAVAYMRPHLSEIELDEVTRRLRSAVQAAASERGLEDWSYEIHYQGSRPTA